jgi:hypothetical protein
VANLVGKYRGTKTRRELQISVIVWACILRSVTLMFLLALGQAQTAGRTQYRRHNPQSRSLKQLRGKELHGKQLHGASAEQIDVSLSFGSASIAEVKLGEKPFKPD